MAAFLVPATPEDGDHPARNTPAFIVGRFYRREGGLRMIVCTWTRYCHYPFQVDGPAYLFFIES